MFVFYVIGVLVSFFLTLYVATKERDDFTTFSTIDIVITIIISVALSWIFVVMLLKDMWDIYTKRVKNK